jgi:hypothetical protein
MRPHFSYVIRLAAALSFGTAALALLPEDSALEVVASFPKQEAVKVFCGFNGELIMLDLIVQAWRIHLLHSTMTPSAHLEPADQAAFSAGSTLQPTASPVRWVEHRSDVTSRQRETMRGARWLTG